MEKVDRRHERRAGAEAIPKNVALRIAKTKSEKEVRDILTEALIELVSAFTAPIYEVVATASDRRE